MNKQDAIDNIVKQLDCTPINDLPEKLKDIRELRTGERKPRVPILFGYPSSDAEIGAYERIISASRTSTSAARFKGKSAPFDVLATHFGGHPYAIAGDCWPDCPSCGCALNFVCQISTNIPYGDGLTARLLYVLYYCFRCRPPASAEGMGLIVGGYWNPSLDIASTIKPSKTLSAAPIKPQALVWAGDVFYIPSTNELDVEELGIPIQYYLDRYSYFIGEMHSDVNVIDGGPYPPSANHLNCAECGGAFIVTYTIFLDGIFSILCCPSHPQFTVGFHSEYEDCAAGPVKFQVLA